MGHDANRMARSELYVDRAVKWIRDCVPSRYASPIIPQGFPDQGDALTHGRRTIAPNLRSGEV